MNTKSVYKLYYPDELHSESIKEFSESLGVKLKLVEYPIKSNQALEWFFGAWIVLEIVKPFLTGFFSEVGKETYTKIKNGIAKLAAESDIKKAFTRSSTPFFLLKFTCDLLNANIYFIFEQNDEPESISLKFNKLLSQEFELYDIITSVLDSLKLRKKTELVHSLYFKFDDVRKKWILIEK